MNQELILSSIILTVFFAMGMFFGILAIRMGIQEWQKIREARSRLQRAQGVVLNVYSERRPANRANYIRFHHYPEIQFHTAEGEAVRFRSETGIVETRRVNGVALFNFFSRKPDMDRKGYTIGQAIPVLYDPDGRISPRIHSWGALWEMPFFTILGGSVIIIAVISMLVFFGSRIFRQVLNS